ncbi:putrescine/spermidine ABC transporter ATPase [Caballeronia glathei]|uniref:Putrescine/spermidine ABC transporter ATPase n=2 Tax=Caballeronia glathei TaxID=60547 RepID=A0A069PXK2_9BURK|nr:putrescine/spermidine ABC transporter ATPase [Caballeronia glathei]
MLMMPLPVPQSAYQSRVSLNEVSKSYGGRRALREFSLDVAAGEFLAVLGPSGSGKTTALRLIAGLETPDEGQVFIEGRDVTCVPAEQRDVNTVFQSYALFPHLNVLDNVAYGPRMRGLSRKARHARAYDLLELVRLSDAAMRRPHELSGGMQQRVALARALANAPAVLLLDEPLGALDRKLRCEMQRELRRVHSELAGTFIYVTHDQEEAFAMADRLAVMREGRIEQVGSPAEIYDRPANAWVARFVGGANMLRAHVDRIGRSAMLTSRPGLIEAGYFDEDLMSGDTALVVIRPEATRIERSGPTALTRTNRLAARLLHVVTAGPSRRLSAVTADGSVFDSIEARKPGMSPSHGLAPGNPVFITFDAGSVRAYRDDWFA